MKGRLLFYADNTQEKSFTSFLLCHCMKRSGQIDADSVQSCRYIKTAS